MSQSDPNLPVHVNKVFAEQKPPLQPWDEHNRRLHAHVHPPDWANPAPAPRYNLVVIGGGTAGLVTAAGAAGLGAKVALIERDLLGAIASMSAACPRRRSFVPRAPRPGRATPASSACVSAVA